MSNLKVKDLKLQNQDFKLTIFRFSLLKATNKAYKERMKNWHIQNQDYIQDYKQKSQKSFTPSTKVNVLKYGKLKYKKKIQAK